MAGSQVTLSSLVNQSRAMLEEQARHLLTEGERQTMGYYLDQYRDGHVGVEQLVVALFELFNTHAKVKTKSTFFLYLKGNQSYISYFTSHFGLRFYVTNSIFQF